MTTNIETRSEEGRDAETPLSPALTNEKLLIKCVVWDLDNTLWDGVLLEDPEVRLRPSVVEIMKTLDERGILQSVASKNEHELAMRKLREFGLHELLLYPQIGWNSKVGSIANIAKSINIGLDAVAFVDDQLFELAEVGFSLPQVLCIDAAKLDRLLDMPQMIPRFITEDSRRRRQMYLSDIDRNRIEEEFVGTKEEFLASLKMVFCIARAREEDLRRAEELTQRTNQLNTTGHTYSYDELDAFRQSDRHRLYVTSLQDKFGSYGKIGLALLECEKEVWTIKLLLMSCRVMSRGVGSILLNFIMQQAKESCVALRAYFVENDRNRLMYITYKFAGFTEVSRAGKTVIMENDLSRVQPFPLYVEVIGEE
jgi:FkbH-like protein